MKSTPTSSKQSADTIGGARPEPAAGLDGSGAQVGGDARSSIRLGSSVEGLAAVSAESDQVQLKLLESIAGITLERVIRLIGTRAPDGDAPHRFATIAASVCRRCAEVDEEPGAPGSADPGRPMSIHSAWTGDIPGQACSSGPSASTELAVRPTVSTALAVYDPNVKAWWTCTRDDGETTVSSSPDGSFSGGASDRLVPAGRSDQHIVGDRDEEPGDIPDFPEFRLNTTIAGWVNDNVFSEDIAEIGTILGTSIARTYRDVRTAMTIIHGLPRFADRVRSREFTIAHVQVVADLCHCIAFEHLPDIDEHLANRRADVTSDRLRTSLRKFISVLEPAEDRSKIAAERRRVDVETYKNGSACLSMTGPADEINACYLRIEAMARAVHTRNGKAFDLPPGVEIVDDRTFDNLMYDIATRPRPKLTIRVRRIDPVTGAQTESEEPLLDDEGNLLFDVGRDGTIVMKESAAAKVGDSGHRGSAFWAGDREQPQTIDYSVSIELPEHSWWLAMQAALITTVPVLSLLGHSNLPGTLPDGSPIPAETARRIAGYCSKMTRILTDPATGTPIDARATTYRIPDSVRKTLIAQWQFCSVPGCSRKAVKSEIDHVIPFFKLDPLKGGLTRFGNLHVLCRKDHALKTAGRLRVRMSESGIVDYEFRHGVTTRSRAPDQPIDVAHALEFSALCDLSPGVVPIPDHLIPEPKDFVDVDPSDEAIQERDEEIRRIAEEQRKAEEEAERQRRLAENYKRSQEIRRRRRLEQLLDWKNVVLPLCLPPGSDPVTMKRLLPGRPEPARDRARRREEAGDEWVEPLNDYWSKPVEWHRAGHGDLPPF